MKTVKKIFLRVFVVVLILFIAYVGLTIWTNRNDLPPLGSDSTTEISTDWLTLEIAAISEYATLEYRYTNVSKFESDLDFYGWKLPFTNKNFMVRYEGSMKLGVQGGEITTTIRDKNIIISLPEVQVLSHVIQEDSIEVFDQTKNIFNQIKIEDYASFATDQKEAMEAKARDEGVFKQAAETAQSQIKGFVGNLPGVKGEYTVTFGTPTENPSTPPNTQITSTTTSRTTSSTTTTPSGNGQKAVSGESESGEKKEDSKKETLGQK